MFDVFAWSLTIGRVAGIRIRVHLFFPIVVLPFVVRIGMMPGAAPGTWIDALWIAVLFALVVCLHELGHAFMARYAGGESDEIMLWPLGGLARASFLPHTPRAHFLFAMGGPMVDGCVFLVSALVLGLCFDHSIKPVLNPFQGIPVRSSTTGLYDLHTWNGDVYATGNLGLMLVLWLCSVAWFCFLFNTLLVGLPWDGGSMGRAVFWPYVGYHQATLYMIASGFVVMALLAMAAIFWSETLLLCLAIYAFVTCWHEWLQLTHRGEESVFGYDFSQGYTSLERDDGNAPAAPARRRKQNFLQRWIQRRQAKKMQREQERQEAEERRMDELLEKIQRHGKESLTDEEQRFMKRVSEKYRNRN